MLFRTHMMFSLLLFLVIIQKFVFSFSEAIVFGIFVLFSTAFVDIDSKNSKFGRIWIFRPIQFFIPHRGMIHSPLFCFLFTFFILFFDTVAGYGFLVGYLSHLFLDLISKEGVVLLWPVSKIKFSLIGIRVGSVFEEIFFVLLLLGNTFIVAKLIFQV